MSVVDWVCKKISLESASGQLSAITVISGQQQSRSQRPRSFWSAHDKRDPWGRGWVNKCFPASLTHAQTLPLAVCVRRARAEKPRGDLGLAAWPLVRARFARVFVASPLSSAPNKTAMLRKLGTCKP